MAGVSTGTGFASNVLSELLKKLVEVVKMAISLPGAVTEMENQVQRLQGVREDINSELAQEQRRARSTVQNWLTTTDRAIARSDSIRNEYDQHKNCLGCCPNYFWRYRISRHIRDWKQDVDKLHLERQADFPAGVSYGDPTPRPQIPIQNPESGFVADTKRSEQAKLVKTWLTDKDSTIRFVAIHGMGGVGKTSLLNIIKASQEVVNSFELIIKVTVSRNVSRDSILAMQKCVADTLNLKDFPDESNFDGRKEKLSFYFKNKRFLLLLDDMWAADLWTPFHLQNLGVSINDPGFKFVLTTRDKEVCARMKVQQTVTVEPLLEGQGWELFRSRAFENRNGNVTHEIEEVARRIAKQCKGLPLAINVFAAAMAHHTELYEWDAALDQLQKAHKMFDDLHDGVDQELFQRLQWSYDVLKPEDLKTCFLYFAAFPEDEEIWVEEVIDIWIADGLVKGPSGESYLHDTAHTLINQLRNRCLIEVVDMDGAGRIRLVKIHDVLRDMAIRIAEKQKYSFSVVHSFKAGQDFTSFEDAYSEGCVKLSLMSNHLRSLPTIFACSSLSVLLLQENRGITEVPEGFLSELPSLKVLDLSGTKIESLPPCIGKLKYLAYLGLERTLIPSLPDSIGDLKELQVLNLSSCYQLLRLPKSISELKRLRVLNISYSGIRHLLRGISELVSLERLLLQSVVLDVEDANAEREYACLKDLQSLHRLRDLSVQLKSPVQEGVMRNWSKMRQLWLLFTGGVNQDYLPQDMREMKDLESLSLEGCDVERLPSWVSEFPKLASLQLLECSKLEELELGMGFPRLRRLNLGGLESLKSVGALAAASGGGGLGEGVSPSLPMLKFVWVDACPQLKRFGGDWDKLNRLERIDGSKEWWDGVQWDDPNIKMSLENKFRDWKWL